jgi:hypothetical protein
MCAVEAQGCVDCVSVVLHTRSDSQGASRRQQACLRSWTRCALVDDRLLSVTTTETSADSPSVDDDAVVELGQNGGAA